MNVTADASIVIKWFVPESMSHEARFLLTRRIRLHAPGLLLAEFANTIWKKARRGEIADPQPFLNELSSLSRLISLYPAAGLIERAAEIAFRIDHPIYDCLYLACAEATDSVLVTADKRLVARVGDQLPEVPVRYIGTPATMRWIDCVIAPIITPAKIEELSAAFDLFSATERSHIDAIFSGTSGLRVMTAEDLKPCRDSPSYRRLAGLVARLSEQERIDLLAIGWLGSDRITNWRKSLEHAKKMDALMDRGYAVGYGQYWRAGYERAMAE